MAKFDQLESCHDENSKMNQLLSLNIIYSGHEKFEMENERNVKIYHRIMLLVEVFIFYSHDPNIRMKWFWNSIYSLMNWICFDEEISIIGQRKSEWTKG